MVSPYRHAYSWWASRLESQQKTSDGFKSLCPSHDDVGQSLHVTRKGADDKPPVIHCFAGCSYSDIEHAANTGEAPSPKVRRVGGGSREDTAPILREPMAWFATYTGVPEEFLHTLDLRGIAGNVEFTFPHNGIAKIRKAGTKDFRWNKPGASVPPFWPEIPAKLGETIYLTEGETDCVILRYLGLEGYAITRGAKGLVSEAVFSALSSRGASRVVLCFDQDEAGEEAIVEYSAIVTAAGLEVATIKPPVNVLIGEKDIRDWFKRTKGEEQLETVEAREVGLEYDDLLKVTPRHTAWISPGYVAHSAVTLIAGPPKGGKTSLVYWFLRCLEHVGEAFLGFPLSEQGKAFILTEEFGPTLIEKMQNFEVRPRVLTMSDAALQGWAFEEALTAAARQAVKSGCSVLVIDTLSAWAGFKDENDAAEVTRAMSLVRTIAVRQGLGVIVIHHTKKGGGEHGEESRGSSAMVAMADIYLRFAYASGDSRQVSVRTRYTILPDDVYYRQVEAGQFEVLDQAEWNLEEATPVINALIDGPKDMKTLIEVLGLSEPTVRKHLRNLEALGKVTVEVGARGRKTYAVQAGDAPGGGVFKVNVRRVRRDSAQ